MQGEEGVDEVRTGRRAQESNKDNNPNLRPDNRPVMNNQLLRLPEVPLSPHSFLSSSWLQINILFTVRIFESRISNEEVTFLLAAAEPLQQECV